MKTIHYLSEPVLDKFQVYAAPEPDEECIKWVYRYLSQKHRCYRFTEALKNLINQNYNEN
jgi:hypothetical protein